MTTMTMREGRQAYFDEFNLGEGGYDDAWVKLKIGPIPFGFPNTEGRKRAVRIHDMHHVVTGYRADWVGEFEISAWEVSTGCRDFWAAWVLNLQGLAAGSLVSPGRIFRAFARGRRSRNLYAEGVTEALLDEDKADVEARLGLAEERPPSATDALAFVAWSAAAWAFTLGSFALLLAPLGGLWWLAFGG